VSWGCTLDAAAKREERYPAYPQSPELYRDQPDTDPEKAFFLNRGFDFATMQWTTPASHAEPERVPAYPKSPQLYAKEPAGSLDRAFFENRGARFEGGHYLGGFQPERHEE